MDITYTDFSLIGIIDVTSVYNKVHLLYVILVMKMCRHSKEKNENAILVQIF